MKPRLTQLVSLLALIALISGMAGASARASIITLTGGDAADASDGIGYVPAAYPVYAYRMTHYNEQFHIYNFDINAYTYKGITFQPYGLNGYVTTPTSGTTTVGSVTSVDDFFYSSGALQNKGVGATLSADDTLLYEVSHYEGFSAANYNNPNGTEIITLGGLIAGRSYQVDLFSATANAGGTNPYTFVTSGAVGSSFTDILPTQVGGLVYDIRETVVADVSGNITVTGADVGPGAGNATVNAFSVEMIPEPASMALITVGALALLRRRR